MERFILNADCSLLTVEIDFTFNGIQTHLVKYLKRKVSYDYIPYKLFPNTLSWLNPSNRNPMVLENTSISYIEAFTVISPSAVNIQETTTNPSSMSLTRRIGDKITDGDKIMLFKFKVSHINKFMYTYPLYYQPTSIHSQTDVKIK